MNLSRLIHLRWFVVLFMSVLSIAGLTPAARGAIQLVPFLSGLSSPLYITSAHDGTNRLFVVEQTGTIRALASGATQPTLFLDISSKIVFGGERGLLGLAFHPQFATNSRFFVDYTRASDGATVIAEYTAMGTPAATAATERVFLVIAQPFANHNGGMIEFGNDGFLYIGMGDGGDANDPGRRAQNIDELLGKILRIDVDHPSAPNLYSSPTDNPFFGATPGRDEIYAVGMRNPFRFSFDRQTHQLYVGDVGQGALEEVDIVTLGGNYGWRVYEGNQCTNLDAPLCNPANYLFPITQYGHTGGRCSITGGYVYRGSGGALAGGTYIFGDYCSGEIFSIVGGTPSVLLDTTLNISSFGEDEAGELYVVGLGGTVHRILAMSSNATTTTLSSVPNPAPDGASVTLTATVAGTNPTGAVNFTESSVSLSGCGAVALSGSGNSRTAVCNINTLAPGAHSIVANYVGDANNAPSFSSPLSQVINAVPTSATFLASDTNTHGNWKGVYGSDGYAVLNDSANYPAYARVTPVGQQSFTWDAQPSDARALQRGASGRIAACWYANSSFDVDINLTDGAVHRVAVYLLDWDTTSRAIRADVIEASSQQVLSTQTVQSLNGGVYLVWNLRGHVILRVTRTSGVNAVLSGIFFDAPGSTTTFTVAGTVTSGSTALQGVHFAAPGGGTCPDSASNGQYGCTVPQGWSGTITPSLAGFGFTPPSRTYSNVAANLTAQDYSAAATASAAATFVASDAATQGNWKGRYGSEGYAVLNDTTNYPSYAVVTPAGKADYVWASQPDTDPRALQRGVASGRIAACWYSSASSFSVDIDLTDQATHRVAFYLLDWDTSSRVTQIDVLDASSQQVLSTRMVSSFNGGVYAVWDLRGHVTLRFTSLGGYNAVLSGIFFDAPIATPTFTLSGAVTANSAPLAGVHFSAPSGGSCQDSASNGQYSCTVPQGWSGTVTPSLAGFGFTPPSRTYSNVAANLTAQDYSAAAAASAAATFVTNDATTQGNWKGRYGSEGYAVLNDTTNYPSYAVVTPAGKADYVWASQPDTDPRALQRGVASGRIAACWYSPASSFSVDINLTDQATHRVAFYLLDWDTTNRAVQIDVLDASTQQVLSTRQASAFNGGLYLVWDLRGHVTLRFSTLGGYNAVLSGIFFDAPGSVAAGMPWNTYGRDAQHSAQSTTGAQAMRSIYWQTPVDLQPQLTGNSILIHYGSPVITALNTVIVPVKTGASGGFRVEARGGSDGALKWSMNSDYVLPPHDWVPSFGPALTAQSRVYFPGAGGTVYFRDQADAASGPSGQIAFYGTSNYLANPAAYDASVMINTPLTTDTSGNVFFGFQVTGSTPAGLTSGIARIDASGNATWVPIATAAGDAAMTHVPQSSAPALSVDNRTLYIAASDGNAGYLLALDSTSLARIASKRLKDPVSAQDSWVSDNGSASPTVGPDGDVYFGVLENPHGSNHFRGWLLHFDGTLAQSKTPASFGWDDTVSIVPSSIVGSYQGASSYLLMSKYNDYAGTGTDRYKLAVLDPNATQTDPVTSATVMKEVITIASPGDHDEWCINSAAVDPATRSIFANNEDGILYRWDLTSNTLSASVRLTSGIGEAYTPTVIGPDGKVYAINNAILFAVGN